MVRFMRITGSFLTDLTHFIYGFFTSFTLFIHYVFVVVNTIIFLIYQILDEEPYDEKLKDIVEFAGGFILGQLVLFLLNICF
ncbi:MAG: hypothetical protein QXW71_01965 [Thermoplasmata archaeon]